MAKVNSKEEISLGEHTVVNKQRKYDPKLLKKSNDRYQSNNLILLHQNICGILHKTDELLIALLEISPQVLCLSEHHLCMNELTNINLSPYTLGAQYCRQLFKKGGVSIFIHSSIQFNPIDLKQFSKE